MAERPRHAAARWTLSDLIDFETLLAQDGAAVDDAGRRQFVHDILPRLAAIADAGERRRIGLRLWLDMRLEQRLDKRRDGSISAGRLFSHALELAGWAAFALLAGAGMALVAGLLLGPHQAVHVVIFLGLTLVLPWLLFAAGLLLHKIGGARGGQTMLAHLVLRLFGGDPAQRARQSSVLGALTEARATRRVLVAVLVGLTQRGAVGFSLGAIVAFVGCLLLFDVRFFWEATPQAGMDAVLAAVVQAIALPWGWAWPQAVPSLADIAATRTVVGALPAAGDGSWWRFLLMSLLVWGLLPRLLLVALAWLQARRALARLDFQAPRHRALWRRLSAIERGEVATGPTDGALVLDVGGHGVSGAAIRGFLLRRLRVNPLQTLPVAVLDDDQEARAEQALAAGPAGVVLLAEGWTLSPRQVEALHGRLRAALGAAVPMIWVVFALQDSQPTAPAEADMQRWARHVDSLRDPAAEVVAYDG